MINNAKESVIIVTSAEGLARKADSLKRALKKAKDRKVKIRIAAPLNKQSEKAAKMLKDVAEVKNINMKGRFCIVDGKEVTFMLMDDANVHPNYDAGVWVQTLLFAQALQSMFEMHWNN